MAPKVKYSREKFLEAAVEIVRERGLEAVTARELGDRLGCSSRPVFTAFKNMEEVQQAVIGEAKKRLNDYLNVADGYELEFKKIGMQMIKFAIEEPKLFQIVYMNGNNHPRTFNEFKSDLGYYFEYSVGVCQRDYGLDRRDAEKLFERLWIHSYGISMLCVTNMCVFTEEEIATALGEVFYASLLLVKAGNVEYEFGKKPKKK